jgi:hypothetical protein
VLFGKGIRRADRLIKDSCDRRDAAARQATTEVVMGIMDKIRNMLGGDAVGGFAPKDDDDDTEGDVVDDELARERVQGDIEAEKLAAIDRLSDADNSGGRGDYRP